MSEPTAPAAVEAPTGARGAWRATSVGIPIHALLALTLGPLGAWAYGALIDGAGDGDLQVLTGVALALVHLVILVVGIALVSHTLGRVVATATAHRSRVTGVASFAVLGGLLALVPSPLFLIDQPHAGAALVLVLVGLVLPCAMTAGTTRLVLPAMSTGRRPAIAAALAAVALVAAGVFAAVVLFGWPL
ncbi:hypothetical protein [Demequina capsici]|uniref:Yip1 domain-containing protein n=1 Tax=Demequina capsici TaxID=3075620 RepID=A0AA96JEE9_9MICO|nr:hypothetical protein [Demequina sp. OYTSA14]WNM25529.1 hypothetical protein RN606_05120 [Demequina sp. OYTSA14]